MSASAKPAAEDKSEVVANRIAERVKDLIQPTLEALLTSMNERLATLELNLSGLHARIEAMADLQPAAKRAVRPEQKTGDGLLPAGAAAAAGVVKTPANAMLWLKQQYVAKPDVRAKYAHQFAAPLAAHALSSKHPVGSAEAYAAEATLIWKGLTATEKSIVKADFDAWKTEKLRTDVPAPLTLDDGAEAEA